MKLSKKFFKDLHKIGEDAFIEKNQWVGKLVPDIVVDNLKKRGITPDDLEGVVCLTVEEAKEIFWLLVGCWWEEEDCEEKELRLNDKWRELLPNRIEQAEK